MLLALVHTTCNVHGYLAKELMASIIVPIAKDSKGDVTEKNNNDRPLAITTVSSKLLEPVINRHNDLLFIRDKQFRL